MPQAVTIDKATKVNLGILAALLVTVAGGAMHLSTLNANVTRMDDTLREVKTSLDRVTNQIVRDGKSLVVLETVLQSIERRVLQLEQAKK